MKSPNRRRICAEPAIQEVVARTSRQRIVSDVADDDVVAEAANHIFDQ